MSSIFILFLLSGCLLSLSYHGVALLDIKYCFSASYFAGMIKTKQIISDHTEKFLQFTESFSLIDVVCQNVDCIKIEDLVLERILLWNHMPMFCK